MKKATEDDLWKAHEEELNKVFPGSFVNFGWVADEESITSKVNGGAAYLTSWIDEGGSIEHSQDF